MLYDALKSLHIVGVVLLLGNVTITAFWKAFADRTGDPAVIAFGQRLVTITDFVFTGSGGVIFLAGGFGAAWAGGLDPFAPGWLLWGQVLFVVSGAIWVGILIPAQIRLSKAARCFAAGGSIPDSYWRDSRLWLTWGIIACLPLVAAIWVMVAKPG
ncbi:DUF2269 family protein [Blastochloris viridis]|uniref:Putative integral membrane protein n=1 Tax=Blastochloris viridis TaxID=1079 RepID=A0A0H5BDA8_BLAVI|nr:DUF2269 domain-containing protein [Blastochloris viridis]ALK09912.1 hypothetical protein BVIR_2143 [Blastochloris viridis]BAS00181.1 hypothetical protein BV133_2587 [Blastochloris viridis]CUU42575.1 putative integral membrane protein [Blastochloris viridis]